MKNRIVFVMMILLGTLRVAHSEETVAASTPTPSIALTGETTTQAIPDAMTAPPNGGNFVTLARTGRPLTDLSASVERIEPERFEILGARNAGDAISRQAGIHFFRTGDLNSTRLASIRGSTSNQTLVLLDGRPIGGAAFSAEQDLAEIPIEQIDHIEIVRGGMSALYGPNALGGVINVISKRAGYSGLPLSHFNFEGRSQNAQTSRLDFGSRWGRVDYAFYGDTARERGFLRNSDARNYNIGGNVGVSMGKAGKLLLDVGSYHSGAGVPEFFERQNTDHDYIRSSYIVPLPKEMLATFRLFGSKREISMDDPGTVNTERTEENKGGEVQLELPWGFLTGAEFIHDRLDSRDDLAPGTNEMAMSENWGLFIQDSVHVGKLHITAGVRHDHDSRGFESNNPRVQLMVDATSWLRFSGSSARSFRAPTLDETTVNSTLNPEKGWTYDGGFELHESSVSFKAVYFRANIRDLIQTTSISPSAIINVGEARREGAELSLHHVINKRLRHEANYTYLKNEGKNLYIAGISGPINSFVPLGLSPKHTANYTLTYFATPLFSIDNTARYISRYFDGNNQTGGVLGDTVLWDVRFAFQLRQAQIYLGINDLMDKRYEERVGFARPGRTMFAGIRIKLWG